MTTTIYLVRHAEAEGNIFRRCHGQYNGLVTPNGLKQLERLSARFAGLPVSAVYASDLYRTHRTAVAAAQPGGHAVIPEPRLREIKLGPWEDRPWGEFTLTHPEQCEYFQNAVWRFSLPGAETMDTVAARMTAALDDIADRHPNQAVAAATHGLALRIALCRLMGLPNERVNEVPYADNASMTTLRRTDGVWRVESIGDNEHLGELSTFARQHWWRKEARQQDINLRFRPIAFPREAEDLLERRRDAWNRIYGDDERFNEQGFRQQGAELSLAHPRAAQYALLGDEIMGVLLLDIRKGDPQNGHISQISLNEEYCGRGLGAQLLGEAVSLYRSLGRRYITLRVWEGNERARRFYDRMGFEMVDENPGDYGPLYVLRRSIEPDMVL